MTARLEERPPARAIGAGSGAADAGDPPGARSWLSWPRGRLLVLTLGVSLLALEWFATAYTFERSVDAVEVVIDEAMPSVAALAEVQGAVARLAEEMRQLEGGAGEPDPDRWIRRDAQAQLRSAGWFLRVYERLPMNEQEREAYVELRATFEELATATRSVLSQPDKATRREGWLLEFLPALDATNEGLRDLVQLNAAQATEAARDTVEAHETAGTRSLILTVGLNGVLVLLWLLLDREMARTDREREARLAELDSFAGRVAHDLRGPLSTMLLALQVARRDDALGDPAARALERAERAGTRMSSLIEGLLAFARAGASRDVVSDTRVADVMANLRAAAGPPAEALRVTLDMQAEPDLRARTSEGVLLSIVQNLVRNAVVHMGEATVREVRVRARGVSPATLELEVADTGPGIPDDVKRRLFRPFERGSTTAEGSGLGLATVKRLVEGHGGSITLDTEVGRGTTFRVRLPRA